jgi:CheY-like chemotaxis protein
VKILITGDDTISHTILRKAVKKLGHDCLVIEDGVKAWDRFRNTPESMSSSPIGLGSFRERLRPKAGSPRSTPLSTI